jgi:4-amino-4-deoxy-L-arabinose transferase-like glycosyltransferase
MLKRLRFTLPKTIFAIALLVLLIQFGFALSEYARHALAAVTFPFPLDYGEGPILDQVLRLAQSENIYRAEFATPPYTVSNYPPLFHLAQVPFALIFGPAFWYGRAISMVSALLAALFIGLTLYTVTSDHIASIAGGLTLLAFPYILQWSAFDRVDTLALALSWAGLFAIVRWPDQRRGLALSVMLLAAAVYTKQSYGLVVPATALVWLLQAKRYRRALEVAGWLGGICLALFLMLNWVTRGGFYFNIVTANVNQFSHINIMAYLTEMFLKNWLLMLGAILFMVVERWWYPTRSWPLVTPYVLLAALASLTVGKAGSSVNYLYEPASALCLAAGAILAWPGKTSKNYWLKTAVVLGLALQINGMVTWSREDYVPFVTSKVHMAPDVAQLAQIVRDAPGPVLADEYMGLIPVAGRKLTFQPFEFSQLQQAGLWNADAMIASIKRQEFSAILLYEPPFGQPMIVTRWTPKIRTAIWANYEPLPTLTLSTLAYVGVYVPRK